MMRVTTGEVGLCGCGRSPTGKCIGWHGLNEQQLVDAQKRFRLEEFKKMKLNIYDIGGAVVKDNETYVLKDNTTLKNLVVSSTDLKPGQSTRGHKHPGQEEVYYFISGSGSMELDDKTFNVQGGDVVLIKDGVFHRVHNKNSNTPLYFVCVFDGNRNH